MLKRKLLGECRTEAEEARWFEENQDRLLKMFQTAAKEGRLRRGAGSMGITIDKSADELAKPPSQKVMLRIPTGDLERARALAAKKGIGYQTYMKSLLHEALDRESRRAG